MKNKKIAISLALFIISSLIGGALYFGDFFATPTTSGGSNITDLQNYYNADVEIAQALEMLKNSSEKAMVITAGNTRQKSIALTFDGLTDDTSIQRILDLLKKYDVKATFFVDGIQTAETPQTVINIKTEGQKVENYTLAGLSKMETLPAERLVKDFCRAQKIIKVTTDQEPNLLKCNDTKYTDQLLLAAKASGFKGLVKSNVFFDKKQTNSPAEAEKFVNGIKPGSIVSIKLKTYIEPIPDEPGKTDPTPAMEKQPGLKELPVQVAPNPEEKNIIEAIENFLVALQKAKYTTVYVEDFSSSNALPAPVKTVSLKNTPETINTKADSSSYLLRMTALACEQIADLFFVRKVYAAEPEKIQAEEIKIISSIEPAIAFTFAGLTNETATNDVLAKLQQLNIKATFFVMELEMRQNPGLVRKIISNGHEIGLALRPRAEITFDEVLAEIRNGRQMLKEQFGVTTDLVKQPWAAIADSTKQAVAASGCKLIGQYVNVVQGKHKEYNSKDEVMAELFGKAVYSLGRGQIVHFRMDFYTNPWLVGNMIDAIKERKIDNIAYVTSFDNPANNPTNDSRYAIKPVGAMLNNTNFLYKYPADPETIPEHLKEDSNMEFDRKNLLRESSKRYIGTDTVTYEDRMLGFSKMEARRLDTTGVIHTNDNVIFLTFDDWGLDASVNKLLYVLRKHNVHGTFFIITNNVLNNPNLLRAIASEGHEIAGHSEKHRPMVIRNERGKMVRNQSKEEYTEDLTVSYKKLLDVTGDVVVDGKPALIRLFRPPTLAISKMGFETLFETGYEYIVSGSYSTQDYIAEDVSELVRKLKEGIYAQKGDDGLYYIGDSSVNKGAVLVMHMTEAAAYTAMALDILLTANAAKDDSDPSKFKVGRLSDYITDGYSQTNRNKSLELTSLTSQDIESQIPRDTKAPKSPDKNSQDME